MKIQEQFSKRPASMLDVIPPDVMVGSKVSEGGVKVTFHQTPGSDGRTLSMDMTPDEALGLAEDLIDAARAALKDQASTTAG